MSDYLDNDLVPVQRPQLEAHLEHCSTCPPLYASLVGVHELAPIIHEKSIEASRSIFVNCSSMVDPIWPLIEWRGGSRRVLDNGSTP